MPNEALRVHVCGPDDREEQARLFNACFKKHLGAEALRWRYDQSPHGRSVSLVMRTPAGEAISGYASSPRLALVHGDEDTLAPVGQTGDVMTHPEWRKRGLFSTLDRAVMAESARLGWPVGFGLPNRRSAHIFLELGWKRVGTVRPWTYYFGAGAPARALRRREGRLREALLPLARLACRSRRAGLRRRAGAELVTRPLERFPAEVIELSRRMEPRYPLMVRRDAAYLNWRFVDTSARLHRSVGVYTPAGELAGYAVVQLPREAGLGYLVDVLAPEPAAEAAAVDAGLSLLEAEGAFAAQATAIDGSHWERVLRRAGFLAPKPENYLIVIAYVHRDGHPLSEVALRASKWYLTDGDRDDETMG